MKYDLVILAETCLTMDKSLTVVSPATICIQDGKIKKISKGLSRGVDTKKMIDASDALVMPGLVNGHTHVGMTLLRGIGDDLPLHEWLNKHIFPLEKKWGNKEFVYLGTQLACLEMIRSGTTTFNDMYYFEDEMARATHHAGLRAIAGQTVIEIGGVSGAIFDQFDGFLSAVTKYPLIKPAIAPHSIYGVSPELWNRVIEYAREKKLFLHLHLQETQEEVALSLKQFKKTPTEYFDDLGVWKDDVIAAHCTCLTETDIALLGKNKVGVAYNPESNLKLGTKIAPALQLREQGCPVAFGTDGAASNNNLDLFSEADMGTKLQAFQSGVGKLTALDAVKMLTSEGARALKLDGITGSLEVGKSADLIVVEVSAPHATPMYHAYSHLIYSAAGADVRDVVVGGKVLMQNRKIKSLDEEAVLKEARKWGKKIAGG